MGASESVEEVKEQSPSSNPRPQPQYNIKPQKLQPYKPNEDTERAWSLLSTLEPNDDGTEIVDILKPQTEKGDMEALWMLGICYEYGIGIEQNKKQAAALYEQSREKGSEVGTFLVSHMKYGKGSGYMRMDSLWI